MKKNVILLLALMVVLIQSSCNLFCVNGNGEIKTEKRTVNSFTEIDFQMKGKILLYQGDECSVEVKCENNLLEYIKTDVSSGTLTIKSSKCFKKTSSIEYHVTLQNLEKIEISGSGEIVGVSTFNVEKLKIVSSGSGNILLSANTKKMNVKISGSGVLNLSGTSDKFSPELSGSGTVNAFDFTSKEVDCELSGSGNCYTSAIDELKADLSGSGNVFYKGNPKKMNTNVTGSGAIKQRE